MRLAPPIGMILATTMVMSSEALADEACEHFMDASVKTALTQMDNTTSDHLAHRLEDFVGEKVDIARIANFTLGKYYPQQSDEDLKRLSVALRDYFVDMLYTSISTSSETHAEILGSHDRRPTDCIVETVFHLGEAGDSILLWRVFHQGEDYRIYDVAIRDGENTLWLSLELRAQFAALLDQKNGSIDAVIENLSSRTTDPL